jgi:hypothetical protein
MINSEVQCNTNGCWYNPIGLKDAGVSRATMTAFSTPNNNFGAASASPQLQTPPVQIRLFEPAFYSPQPHYSVLPYTPTTVSVVSPVYNNVTQGEAVASAAATAAGRPYSGYAVNACGPCGTATSQLPPTGFEAWRGVIDRNNLPYEDVFGAGLLQGPARLRF